MRTGLSLCREEERIRVGMSGELMWIHLCVEKLWLLKKTHNKTHLWSLGDEDGFFKKSLFFIFFKGGG